MINQSRTLSTPVLGLLVGTRFALGVGVGLLLAGRLERRARIGAGCALAAVGAATTIPLALQILGRGGVEEVNPSEAGRSEAGPVAAQA
jgi:hypothetical protein